MTAQLLPIVNALGIIVIKWRRIVDDLWKALTSKGS